MTQVLNVSDQQGEPGRRVAAANCPGWQHWRKNDRLIPRYAGMLADWPQQANVPRSAPDLRRLAIPDRSIRHALVPAFPILLPFIMIFRYGADRYGDE